ncbi:metallophosphoesterase [soil metagenome]
MAALLACACIAAGACGITAGGAGDDSAATGRDNGFRVAVISDMNSAYGSTTYRPEVATAVTLIRERWRPDLVLAAGDMIAGQRPSLTDDNVQAMWAAFDAEVAAPLRTARIPFGFALGNHDGSAYPAHARDRAFAIEHWRSTERETGLDFIDRADFPLYYSFRQGPLFVVVWDATSAIMAADTTLLRWLDGQLAGEAARAARFRIVLGHLPLYAVAEGRDRPGEVLDDADALRARLERHDVHMYISGHHHAYYAGRRGGIELLHTGALGEGPRPLLGTQQPSPRTVTILDFDARSADVRITTVVIGDEMNQDTVPLQSLPRRIDGHNGYVLRRDVQD